MLKIKVNVSNMFCNRYENSLSVGFRLNTRPNLLPGKDKVRRKRKKKQAIEFRVFIFFHFIDYR